ncbi:MAG: hypothetical protein HKN16_12530 [Saprospiraceae bacterium]|nr:hypothetical protein [Saprospiraceae bacterium]
MPVAPFWKDHWIPAVILMLLGVALYSNTIGYDYVLDDAIVIEKNNLVKKGFAGINEIMTTESFTGYFGEQRNLVLGARYRPLSLVTFAIESQIFGTETTGGNAPSFIPNSKVSHFLNILFYGVSILLLYRLLVLWLPSANKNSWWWTIPFVTALLFCVHPIHSEVVANVKGRDEILAVLLSISALIASWKYLSRDNLAWLLLAAGLFMLGLLSKENSLTIIAVVPLAGYFFGKFPLSRMLIVTMVFALVGLGYLVIRSDIIGYFLSSGNEITDIMNNPFANLNAEQKYATVFYTLGQYIKLLVFPHPLTHDYYPYHIPIMEFGNWKVIFSLIANLGLGLLGLWGLLKKRIWAFGILFYFITLSIVSNIPFTVGTFMNERFVYLPSIGASLIFAWIALKMLPSKLKGIGTYAGYGLIGIMLAGFVFKTLERTPAWTSALTLNAAAIKISKNSARANLFYGTAVFEEYKVENDRTRKNELLDVVSKHVNRAVEINTNYYSGWTMVAGVVAEEHKRDRDLDKCLNGFYRVLNNRPNIDYIDQYLDYLKDREDAVKILDFCVRSGKMFTQKRDFNNATRLLNHGNSLDASYGPLRQALGEMYLAMGDQNRAAQYLN